jgi:hypothetical protein
MDIEQAVARVVTFAKPVRKVEKEHFTAFSPADAAQVIAVDGSAAVLFETPTFAVCARRVGYVAADENRITDRRIGEMVFDIIESDRAADVNAERMQEQERALAESLHAPLILCDGTAEDAIDGMVYISKHSSLKSAGVPLLPAIKRTGDRTLPNRCWYYRAGEGVYIVKFHPYAPFVFRADCSAATVGEVLPELATCCDDVGCPGYPYPLAEVHRLVTIDRDETAHLQRAFVWKLVEEGFGLNDVEQLFYDYHDHLR